MPNLTQSQLHCIARHIQEYVKKEMHGESDFPNACTDCPVRQPEIHCHWDAFIALSEATGVGISPRVKGEASIKTINQLGQERGLEPIKDERCAVLMIKEKTAADATEFTLSGIGQETVRAVNLLLACGFSLVNVESIDELRVFRYSFKSDLSSDGLSTSSSVEPSM
ncbi:hypothetical protein SAMN02745215_02910 [Desulfitobacterium chlororespirans DSM 11544]|uniref:Uncharacterized protein n=1 Tax=Desulfitobacterium chlororespirans DSM 11544 TaxID=1121395 RepID=A0A1M7U3Z1_9FIRM|nr:hypothetical protein SAMN02745215_02910 [Desulfitobacterium chlororespirans DSM 11544]